MRDVREGEPIQRAWHVHIGEQQLHIGSSLKDRQRLVGARTLDDGEARLWRIKAASVQMFFLSSTRRITGGLSMAAP